MMDNRPIRFTEREGGDWKCWDEKHPPGGLIHSVEFSDGKIFDSLNGWRWRKGAAPQPVADPWAHRSSGMRCATCMWFVTKAADVPAGPRGSLGRCRRHAPTMSGFPAVFEADWCGDHKLDETKT